MKKIKIAVIFIVLIIITFMGIFTYPIDDNDQSLLKQAVQKFGADIVFDAMWNNVVRYTTFFESLDGYGVTNAAFSGQDVLFSLPNTTGSEAEIHKNSSWQPFLSFNAKQFFRITLVSGGAPSLTNVRGKIVVGGATVDGAGNYTTNNKSYGFKIDGTSLYGMAGDGTSETTLLIGTIAVSTAYNLTAKYFPAEHKVIFYIDGIQKGVITTTLPISSGTTSEPNFFKISFTNNENVAGKTYSISMFDFIQNRVQTLSL